VSVPVRGSVANSAAELLLSAILAHIEQLREWQVEALEVAERSALDTEILGLAALVHCVV
jgi:hypothetical protein